LSAEVVAVVPVGREKSNFTINELGGPEKSVVLVAAPALEAVQVALNFPPVIDHTKPAPEVLMALNWLVVGLAALT
jgi:hypothetical protein